MELDGRYRLGECIGQGGMGQVHRAEDLVLGRTVAVKVMRPGGDVARAPERVRNEVTLLAAVHHPSLVTLLDARIDDAAGSYIVMEYVDGPSLAQRLRGGPLTEVEAATLAQDIASGLDAVHSAGVVHRDLTPSNILLASSALSRAPFHAKLADFGVAFLIDSTRLTTPGMVVGTAAYLAPEQVRGDAAAPPADIYALGLVLLESLTGERAYPHASGVGAVMARLVEPPKIPSGVGTAWTELITRMTSTDPAERPDAREVAAIAADLRRTARPVVVVDGAVAASVASAAEIPTMPVPAAPIAVAAPAPRRAGSGERARLRRSRVRAHRMRKTALLVGAAALTAALVVPAGLWASAGLPDDRPLIATEPGIEEPDPLVPVEPSGFSGRDAVPASSSTGESAGGAAATDGTVKPAAEDAKGERERDKAAREAQKEPKPEKAGKPDKKAERGR